MYFLFKFFVCVVAMSTAILGAKIPARNCNGRTMSQCREPLKILSGNREFSFAANKQELDLLCPDVLEGLTCIDDYYRDCMDPHERAHFYRLYAGSSLVLRDLCQEGPFQEEYLMHAPCLTVAQTGNEVCGAKYQSKINLIMKYPNGTLRENLSSDDNIRKLCCSFRTYLNCSEENTRVQCGEDTAEFATRFLYKMASSLIELHCYKYNPGTPECYDIEHTDNKSAAMSISFVLISAIVFLQNWVI